MKEPVELIAGLPHMHRLGRSLRFEVAGADGVMKEVFKRDPFSFDDQHVDNIDSFKLAPGNRARVTCEFSNTLSQEVNYGESSNDEMCFFVGFAIDRQGGACVDAPPLNP